MNNLEYSTIFQTELDKQIIQAATSGWMEVNAKQVKYSGGSDVKIPIIEMDGLADYDRGKGFTNGAVTSKYQTLTMTQDRNRSFMLDRMDVDETNFVVSAGNVMGEFQKIHVVPEIDAYRYSAIAASAPAEKTTSGYMPAAATVLSQLKDDIYKIQSEVGEGIELVISMSYEAAKQLSNVPEIEKKLDVTDFKKGDITTKVQSIDEIPIIKIPSNRMYTEYFFKDGETAGQEEGGFEATAGAKKINWIITARSVPIAVSKTDLIRIFAPGVNINADAWKLDYRRYHDLWIMRNKQPLIALNIQ